ncbi:MAG: thioredoxin domain-containing protein [Gemmatimonadetes bacterium]|nr:thioredoxin domain-containing protein [Gemmatimonadota bacterium]
MSNRLAEESSPYLLQHAENPVDWRPWSAEAFDEARRRDVPVLLSIGYSACHWCHVMERESFEDPTTAELMNESFVNIKVDREERPDIDSVYMKAVQAMTGQGGWPLTAFLTSDGEPFFGGTYFPPEPRPNMPSFRQILESIRSAYDERREEIVRNAAELKELMEKSSAERTEGPVTQEGEALTGPALLDHSFRFLASRFDQTYGGFGGAPKFPQPVTLEFALRVHARTGDPEALEMVTRTLSAMARGGIHDHLGGGFHRYSVDARWLVPHFEKMLYDNALLGRLYVNAYQVTGDPELRWVAEGTLEHLLTDMRAPEGGFYSALDADSEGEEGTFYIWTPAEVRALLDKETADLFMRCYDVSEAGNFEKSNILHLPHDLGAVAKREGMKLEALRELLQDARQILLEARKLREPPFRDEKILASWNGMAIRALAEAGGALNQPRFLEAAVSGLDFLLGSMREGDRLRRSYKDGTARIDAFLEDYGGVGNAILSVYEATLEPRWLKEAAWITERVVDLFWDDNDGIFHDGPKDGEVLTVRARDLMDNATPSGNSLAVELLIRSAHLFGEERHRDIANRVLDREAGLMARFPSAFGRLLGALDRTVADPVEIAIVGARDDSRTLELLQAALSPYLPNRTIAGTAPGEALPYRLPVLEGRDRGTEPTAYVCERYACKAPVFDAVALAEQLDGG